MKTEIFEIFWKFWNLEKEKNSNFNVENFVVMFIYWGTINNTKYTLNVTFQSYFPW